MHTVLSSRSSEVVIGPDQPFCIIGERINPTGRKAFAEALRAGDLSEIVTDVEEQVAMGAHVLDVNMGVPLTDEADLLAPRDRARPGAHRPADLHRLVGRRGARGRPRRLRGQGARQLRHLRATIGSSGCCRSSRSTARPSSASTNDETGIPQTADERLEVCERLVDVVHGDYEIPLEDIVIDPLAMTVGADPQAVVDDARDDRRDPRGVRPQHDARRLEHLVRAAQPPRAERRVPRGSPPTPA